MIDEDARDIGIHDSIELLVGKIMQANGFTRKQALERFVAFAENDEEAVRFQPAPRPRRRRRANAEAHA